jgi:hypothetical protein
MAPQTGMPPWQQENTAIMRAVLGVFAIVTALSKLQSTFIMTNLTKPTLLFNCCVDKQILR